MKDVGEAVMVMATHSNAKKSKYGGQGIVYIKLLQYTCDWPAHAGNNASQTHLEKNM